MSFHFIFVSIIIYCFFQKIETVDNNMTKKNNKLNDSYLTIKNTTNSTNIRELDESRPIEIFVDTTILENILWQDEDLVEMDRIKEAIEVAKEAIKKLIKTRTKIITFDISDCAGLLGSNSYKNLIDKKYNGDTKIDADMIIFLGGKPSGIQMEPIAALSKYQQDSDGRVRVGFITYNYLYKKKNENFNEKHRKYLLNVVFMHLFIHFLGFDKDILRQKKILDEMTIYNRIKTGNFIKKFIVKDEKILDYAQKYFNCKIDYIEFSRETDIEDLPSSHWEGRFLLGDIMSSDFYYPEQVISEFTLMLLELLGWYDINHYTGGLMKYGKGLGCSFFKDDCIDISKNSVSFPNLFCEYSFGTCSFGRQSRSYCGNGEKIDGNDIMYYTRNGYSGGYGLKMVDYCPVSKEEKLSNNEMNYYFIGSCNIGNGDYGKDLKFIGDELSHKYEEFKDVFKENIGENSFCALSSIIQANDNISNQKIYQKMIRPTCYEMSCSEKSLTIRIDSEYIVCPRYGGLVKVEGEYTKYVGYIFCPDYNLICSGKKLCSNLFDCIDKGIEPKDIPSDNEYYRKNISYNSELKTNNEDEITKYYSISQDGYELSEDGKCPLNCMQCLSDNRCILCGNSMNFYIGDKDDGSSPINCTNIEKDHGYYNFIRDGHKHFFKCVDGCDICINAESCSQCFPEFYLSDDGKKCIERIPNCSRYDNSSESVFIDPKNNNGKGYKYCLECDNENNYYCINNNKSKCEKIEDDISYYYSLEPNKNYPCVNRCDIDYSNCRSCDKDHCFNCDPRFYFDDSHICTERIPNCKEYNEKSDYIDILTNNRSIGYKECKVCEDHHYCIKDDKTICKYIESLERYYTNKIGCQEKCEDKFTFVCLKCIEDECQECQTKILSTGYCVKGVLNCLVYDKESGDDTFMECLHCDEANGYYCIDNNRTSCENVNRTLYFKLEPISGSVCIRKCDRKYIGCEVCDESECQICKDKYEPEPDKKNCSLKYEPQNPDNCRVITQEINDDIDKIDFEKLTQNYRKNIYYIVNTVIHYVNKDYTMAMFINSDCTESLLEEGYYKIDAKDLNRKMVEVVGSDRIKHGFLFNFFIKNSKQNHYRIYDLNDQYLDPKQVCTECEKVPFILTIKYNNTISVVLGPILSSAIVLEKLDIFSKDSEVFTDLCQNITLEGVDIPLNDRLHYLYFGDDSLKKIACGGDNCVLEEVNKEESISVCKCTLNEYTDLLKEEEIVNEKTERPEIQSSSSDSFGIIKCAKNGFHAHNVRTNGGFYICLIVIVAVGVLILCYFLCSKIITTSEKGLNPPSKIKNRLRIASNWDKTEEERKKMKKFNEELMNDFQPRDGHEDELFEEEKDYSYIYYDMSNSFDTALFEKKLNNRGRGDKTRKILVLLPGTKKNQNEEENFSSSESSPLDGPSKKKKKTFCQIYWHVLSLKQHIINFFSFCTCINITESYIPLPIRIIRSLFLVVLSFLLSILFLDQKYYSNKFKYFNEKYKLIAGTTDGVTIAPEEVVGGVPSGELWSYSFSHTFVNGLIVFALLLVAQFLIGIAFFSLRNKVIEVLKKNDTSGINELVSQTRIKYIVFFIIVGVLLVLFLFVFIAFGGAYGGGFSDYFLPGIIALIFLEIFPFLWSLIISLLYYLGIKQKSKCCRQTSRFFMF